MRMRIFWRLTSKRRFVATIEWLRLFPVPGRLLQITHTLDTARKYSHRGGTQGSPASPLLQGWRVPGGTAAKNAVFAAATTVGRMSQAIRGRNASARVWLQYCSKREGDTRMKHRGVVHLFHG